MAELEPDEAIGFGESSRTSAASAALCRRLLEEHVQVQNPDGIRKLPDTDGVVPHRLAHVVLRTSNYAPMVDWWSKALNARMALEVPHISFLTFDDEHHRLAIVKVPRLTKHDPNSCGVDHVAFTYSSLGELLATYRRLTTVGIKPIWPINHGMTISFYYEDPDGNRVEFQFDSFPTSQELQDYFENDPDYAVNPLGAEFDPEDLIRRYEAGEPIESLRKVPPLQRTSEALLAEMGLGESVV